MTKPRSLVPSPGSGSLQTPSGGDRDEEIISTFVRAKESPHTRRAYVKDLAMFRATVPKPLAAVSLMDLQTFSESLRGRASSRARRLSSVKSLFKFAHRIGYLRFDPAAVVKLPKIKDSLAERILSREDVERMLAIDDDGVIVVRFLYVTGARVDELCKLAWQDCIEREDGGQVTLFGKGGKTRVVYMSKRSWNALLELRPRNFEPTDSVFGIQPRRAQRIVKRIAKKAAIPSKLHVSPHWLRHAHASHAIDAGAPLPLVQATLGHVSLATTGRYTHIRPKDSSARYLDL